MDAIHAGVEYYNNHAAKPFCHPYTPFLYNYYQFVHNGVCSQLLHIGTVLEICTKLYHQYIKRYIFFQYSPEKLRFFFIHQLFLKTVKTTLFPHTFKCCCT